MKVTVKTLKGAKFAIEVEEAQTMADVKAVIVGATSSSSGGWILYYTNSQTLYNTHLNTISQLTTILTI